MKTYFIQFKAFLILFLSYFFIGLYITSNHSLLILWMQLLIIPLYFIYNYYHRAYILLNSIFLFSIVLLIGMIIENDFSRGALYPVFLILIFFLLKIRVKPIPKALLISFIIFFNSFFIFPNYFELVQVYKKIESIGTDVTKLNLVDENNNPTILTKEGILVIDFWNTTCGICFKKFPLFDEIAKNYNNRKDIQFIAINVPVKRDEELYYRANKINTFNYKFDKLYSIKKQEVEDLLNFNTYPHTLIVKNGKVIKSNLIINPKNVFINNLRYELKKIIEND